MFPIIQKALMENVFHNTKIYYGKCFHNTKLGLTPLFLENVFYNTKTFYGKRFP